MATKRTRTVKTDTAGAEEFPDTFKAIRSRFGESSIHPASEHEQPERIGTGVFMLDFALLGGIPHNRISMLIGERSSGKSMLADMITANAQRQYPNMHTVKIDTEGCIAWYERILDTTTGRVYTAEEIFLSKLPITVSSFDETSGEVIPKSITHWFDNGLKEVYRVTTTGGASGDFTPNHRFLVYTREGEHVWVRTDELIEGVLVCRPKHVTVPFADEPTIGADRARLIGYMLGDGYMGGPGTPGFTNIDLDVIEDVRQLCKGMDVCLVKADDRHYRMGKRLDGTAYTRWDGGNPVRNLMKDVGLSGVVGADKCIPQQIMSGTAEEVSACLTGLYLTDGSVHANRPTLSFTNISREMIEQMRYLWSRYGVVARVSKCTSKSDTHNQLYVLQVNGIGALRIAYSTLSLIGYKQEALGRWVNASSVSGGRWPIGTYYPDFYLYSPRDRQEEAVRDRYLNPTGVYWEQVVSVHTVGKVQTYDFTVADTHNLVVNDMVVHNSHDTVWSTKLGVDPTRQYVFAAETGESAVDAADALVRTKEVSLVVIDSIAALTPMKEIDSSAEDAMVGAQARLVGGMIRRVNAGLITERNRGHYVTVLFTNQWRSKIGVVYGDSRCLHADTRVVFTNGDSLPIRQIVDSRIEGEVWAYDESVRRYVASRITGWHYNGEVEDGEYLSLLVQGVESDNGRFGLTVTRDHLLLTSEGWRAADDMLVGDMLCTKYPTYMNGTLREFVYGMCCGDVSLTKVGTTASLRLEDVSNDTYLEWKVRKLQPFYTFRRVIRATPKGERKQYAIYGSTEFGLLHDSFRGKRHPATMLREYSNLSMAVWVMDDGYLDDHNRIVLTASRLSRRSLLEVLGLLEKQGLVSKIKQNKQIVFTASSSRELASRICCYVPECMQYKLPTQYRGQYVEFSLCAVQEMKATYTPVLAITEASSRKLRQRGKYDITVEGHHNYLAGGSTNGVTVHNSIPGGKALEFATSVQLIVKNKEQMGKDQYDVEAVAENEHVFDIKKNKINAGPRTGEFRVRRIADENLGLVEGQVDDASTMLAYAKKFGVYTGAGSSWTLSFWDEEHNFRGLAAAVAGLYSNRVLYDKLRNFLICEQATHLGMPQSFIERFYP